MATSVHAANDNFVPLCGVPRKGAVISDVLGEVTCQRCRRTESFDVRLTVATFNAKKG